jgi:hypothetical protein
LIKTGGIVHQTMVADEKIRISNRFAACISYLIYTCNGRSENSGFTTNRDLSHLSDNSVMKFEFQNVHLDGVVQTKTDAHQPFEKSALFLSECSAFGLINEVIAALKIKFSGRTGGEIKRLSARVSRCSLGAPNGERPVHARDLSQCCFGRTYLYPNLFQYAPNRAQATRSQPNGVFSFQAFTSEPERNHPS